MYEMPNAKFEKTSLKNFSHHLWHCILTNFIYIEVKQPKLSNLMQFNNFNETKYLINHKNTTNLKNQIYLPVRVTSQIYQGFSIIPYFIA